MQYSKEVRKLLRQTTICLTFREKVNAGRDQGAYGALEGNGGPWSHTSLARAVNVSCRKVVATRYCAQLSSLASLYPQLNAARRHVAVGILLVIMESLLRALSNEDWLYLNLRAYRTGPVHLMVILASHTYSY